MSQNLHEDLAKQRKQLLMDLNKEIKGEYLDLGKKISTPRDVMIEELKLLSNRGSRMFHERLKRVEKYTVENTAGKSHHEAGQNQTQDSQANEDRKEDFSTETFIGQPGKNSLVSALKTTVAKKGNPNILAPGYSGPLKDMPYEKFNVTVIPKSYCSPWRDDSRDDDKLLTSISTRLPEPPQKLTPASYKCFNRAPIPFGGTAGSTRTLPLPGFELSQAITEPSLTWERISNRPNFNRAPLGWGRNCKVESSDL